MKKENYYINYDGNSQCIKLVLFASITPELIQMLEENISEPLWLIGFSDYDLNKDFSPWPYDKFAGEGKKTIESALEGLNGDVIVAGYSMGGLLALCASVSDPRICACASVSGSLWYPELILYLMNNTVKKKSFYFSLGDEEFKTKKVLMSNINERTMMIKDILIGDNKVYFEWNDGNHFQSPEERLIKGIKYLVDIQISLRESNDN